MDPRDLLLAFLAITANGCAGYFVGRSWERRAEGVVFGLLLGPLGWLLVLPGRTAWSEMGVERLRRIGSAAPPVRRP